MLTNGTVRNLIQTGQVGQLAATYQENGLNGSVNFFQNPNALGADMLNNYSNSTYNSLQVEARHRATAGLEFTANYTFSKVLSDTAGDSQSRIEQFLDVNNPKIERARANFDLRHSIKGTAVYDLPFGKGHMLHYRPVNKVIEGWSLGGIMSWQSGAPFSILSGYGTFNRSDGTRSHYNTADTALTMSQLNRHRAVSDDRQRSVMVAQSAINPNDGTGTNSTGEAPFTGQVFSNPGAGTIGTLQRRMFSGPWSFDLDMSLQRKFQNHRAAVGRAAHGRRQRSESSDFLGGRPEHQLHYVWRDRFHVEQPACHAVCGAVSILNRRSAIAARPLPPRNAAFAAYPWSLLQRSR